ncbi:OmpA family protein [Lutibacter sp.]|uniref:OmpA family protein n=1 Tax=Lutibacter sp. TaxID=1925666 RepID=UPI0025BB6FBE|nr:OmpA family protein [Lutibacter sp.]MCF6180559.1 OmpA family protein [Lutibacter sp.]
MKHFKVAILALLLITGLSNVNAQDKNNPWAVGVGVNAVDFYPTNPGLTGHGSWFNEFANADAHYNILPSVSKITVSRYLNDGFTFEVAGTLNKIKHDGDINVRDLIYYGVDGAVKYNLYNLFGESTWFEPYASVGGGYTWLGHDLGTGTFNGGLGINIWVTKNIGFTIETKYKHTFDSKIVQHFQHSAGIVVKFGGTDTDGDGVYDNEDACPEVFGLAEFKGCPDSDNDGVIDSEDACPNVAGLATLNGCPDADGDGIADKDDACPNVKGSKANKGCPDTDGDGVVDKDDACPQVAGPSANKGCPWPDTDKDGVLDKDDHCIDIAGPASNNGCPVITQVEVAKLEELFKTVYFDSGKSNIKNNSASLLDEAAIIITKYPTAKFSISGFADSTGSAKRNLQLTDDRANAVKNYLVSKGVSSNNLTAKGYGEANPIASNRTRAGRAENRRVEIKLVK